MVRVSALLRNTVKLSDKRAYEIAHEANLHFTTLSRLINGIDRIKPRDPRVIAIGRVLGIPEIACFEGERPE